MSGENPATDGRDGGFAVAADREVFCRQLAELLWRRAQVLPRDHPLREKIGRSLESRDPEHLRAIARELRSAGASCGESG